jgi:hypothetical protein
MLSKLFAKQIAAQIRIKMGLNWQEIEQLGEL